MREQFIKKEKVSDLSLGYINTNLKKTLFQILHRFESSIQIKIRTEFLDLYPKIKKENKTPPKSSITPSSQVSHFLFLFFIFVFKYLNKQHYVVEPT